MIQWEYYCTYVGDMILKKNLLTLGIEGWELVTIFKRTDSRQGEMLPYTMVLKRPLEREKAKLSQFIRTPRLSTRLYNVLKKYIEEEGDMFLEDMTIDILARRRHAGRKTWKEFESQRFLFLNSRF